MNTTITESQLAFARDQRAKLVPHSFDEETGTDMVSIEERREVARAADDNLRRLNAELERVKHAHERAQRDWFTSNAIVEAHQDVFGC